MRNYEVTFIVDPVLSGDEIKSTAKKYFDYIEKNNGKIIHIDEMGLRQLAYSIKKRTTGIYYCVEFEIPGGEMISNLELTFRRDEKILRFLTVSLDKYGVKYNQDKRAGLIGKKKKENAKKEGAKKGAKSAAPATKKVEAAAVATAAAATATATATSVTSEEE